MPDGNEKKSKLKRISKIIGPGLVTGASDDDPSGIATYSQAGAQLPRWKLKMLNIKREDWL